jgi:hypothetical protein
MQINKKTKTTKKEEVTLMIKMEKNRKENK